MKSSEIAPSAPRKNTAPLLLLLLIALAVRGGVLFISLSSLNDDPDAYAQLADNWYSYGVFGDKTQATAFRPPLYPWLLKELVWVQSAQDRARFAKRGNALSDRESAKARQSKAAAVRENLSLSRNASIAFLHWLLGVLTVAMVYKLARLSNLSPGWSVCAGLLVAFDPILLQQSRLVMTETLAAFFAAALILGTTLCVQNRKSRFRWMLFLFLGALFGLSTLCRPAFFAFAGLVFLGLVFVEIKNSFADAVVLPGLFLVGVALAVSPWLLRNLREFDKPILTTTHGGYTLYLANNPKLYRHYENTPAWTLWNPEEFHERRTEEYGQALESAGFLAGSKEAELFQDRWTREKALETIKENRQTFLYSCVLRVGELWRVLPNDVPDKTSRTAKRSLSGQVKTYARYAVALFYTWEFFFAALALISLAVTSCRSMKKQSKETVSRRSIAAFGTTPLFWGVLLVLSVQIPHLFYWTNMRMRAPLEVFVPIVAILGVYTLKQLFFTQSLKTKNTEKQ